MKDGKPCQPSDGHCRGCNAAAASADNNDASCSVYGSNRSNGSSAHNTYNSYTIRASCSCNTHSALTTCGDVVHQCNTRRYHKEAGDAPCSSMCRNRRSKRSMSDRLRRCSSRSERRRNLRYQAHSCACGFQRCCTSPHHHRCHKQDVNLYNDRACANNGWMSLRYRLPFQNSQKVQGC